MNKPNILFLADMTHPAKAVMDHIMAITKSDKFNWHVINPLTCKIIDRFDFSLFDAIGLHYSIKSYNNYYLSSSLKKRISEFNGTKFLFLQDEYQYVNLVQDFLYSLGFDLLFTLVNSSMIHKAYPDPRLNSLKKISVLTGYVQDYMKLIVSPPIYSRKIDVSYRGRPNEYWLGSLANEKQKIATEFIKYSNKRGLCLDISVEESKRVYGDSWLKLLMNSKAVLGTESGASIWDFDSTIEKKTKNFLKKNKKADFELVYENVLKPYEGNVLYNAVSPRVFEAAATRTPMVMFPGEYSGVCKSDIHYIPLEKDFTNFDDVILKLKNNDYLQELADRTYNDLIASNLFSQHIFSNLVSNEIEKCLKIKPKNYSKLEISLKLKDSINKHKYLNKTYCLITEIVFISHNFFKLLFDSRYNLLSKSKVLGAGFARYMIYLLARLKNYS